MEEWRGTGVHLILVAFFHSLRYMYPQNIIDLGTNATEERDGYHLNGKL